MLFTAWSLIMYCSVKGRETGAPATHRTHNERRKRAKRHLCRPSPICLLCISTATLPKSRDRLQTRYTEWLIASSLCVYNQIFETHTYYVEIATICRQLDGLRYDCFAALSFSRAQQNNVSRFLNFPFKWCPKIEFYSFPIAQMGNATTSGLSHQATATMQYNHTCFCIHYNLSLTS